MARPRWGKVFAVRAVVIGHVEWVDFAEVDHIPIAGEIVHARSGWSAPAGGGSVAAVQLAKLAGGCTFFTALGDDDLGRHALQELTGLGLRVEAVFRPEPTRRAITHIDRAGERTITVLGSRLTPEAADLLPWEELEHADAVYVCASDAQAVRLARSARALVATSRIILPTLRDARIELDALVGSALDPAEAYVAGDLDPAPRLVVRTEGGKGGTYAIGGEPVERYEPATVPGEIADAYGCGDSFAAALAYALAGGRAPEDAIGFGARCGAAVLTGHGPYEGQLTRHELEGA
ncbi:MAG: PfkB family carbohydrate kinase [Actinomycetota bacterium]